MKCYSSSEILIGVLRSTSSLLEHYGYCGHDPSLSELQRSLGRAITQLEAQPTTYLAGSKAAGAPPQTNRTSSNSDPSVSANVETH
jgi:hypothetical protein